MAELDRQQVAALLLLRRRRKNRKQRLWVHPLNLLRPSLGEHLKLEMMYPNHPDKFFDYSRLTPAQFDEVQLLLEDSLSKQDTNYRLAIPIRQRMFVGLRWVPQRCSYSFQHSKHLGLSRFLVTGDSFATIATSFSLGKSTVREIVYEFSQAVWDNLSPIYMKVTNIVIWC